MIKPQSIEHSVNRPESIIGSNFSPIKLFQFPVERLFP